MPSLIIRNLTQEHREFILGTPAFVQQFGNEPDLWPPEDVSKLLCAKLDIPLLAPFDEMWADEGLYNELGQECHQLRMLPLWRDGNLLSFAVEEPWNYGLIPDIIGKFKCQFVSCGILPDDLDRILGVFQMRAESAPKAVKKEAPKIYRPKTYWVIGRDRDAYDRLVRQVLIDGVLMGASDIMFEPKPDCMDIRICVHELWQNLPPIDKSDMMEVINALKRYAGLDPSCLVGFFSLGAPLELPNGSRINFRIECQSVQLPTEKSQAFCFRPQDSSKVAKGKMPLPFDEPLLSQVRFALSKDQGILLTTGPTGSGKTTTLHACLSELDAVRTNIRTVEDPVEYTVRDYGQIPVGLAASKDGALTPLKALHSNLRFKPSTILMGEIRSLEVAQVTFEAALTGHRLMATLHTDDALGAIPRLLHLEGKGIDASILSQTVRLILAQRMVRLLCDNCKIPESITPLMREHFEFYHLTVPSKLHRRGGCAACKNTGYSGRKPIFEGVLFDEGMRRIVADPKGFDKLAARKHWRECQRAKPLGQAGLELVACGRAAYNDVAGYDNIFEPKGLFESEPSNGPG